MYQLDGCKELDYGNVAGALTRRAARARAGVAAAAPRPGTRAWRRRATPTRAPRSLPPPAQ